MAPMLNFSGSPGIFELNFRSGEEDFTSIEERLKLVSAVLFKLNISQFKFIT